MKSIQSAILSAKTADFRRGIVNGCSDVVQLPHAQQTELAGQIEIGLLDRRVTDVAMGALILRRIGLDEHADGQSVVQRGFTGEIDMSIAHGVDISRVHVALVAGVADPLMHVAADAELERLRRLGPKASQRQQTGAREQNLLHRKSFCLSSASPKASVPQGTNDIRSQLF